MRQTADAPDTGAESGRLPPGAVVGGRFRVEAELPGEGGGTRLYSVTDERAPAPEAGAAAATFALRVIPFGAIQGEPEDLLGSIAHIQLLRHKNLTDVEASGQESGFLFMVMEPAEGKTLRGFMDAKRSQGVGVSLKGATNLVAHVANALEHVSHLGAHGALNPALIWVSPSGRVKVSGFGLGAQVPGLARLGFPDGASASLYVAPERAHGGAPPTPRGDVYSLGAMFYELLTGQALVSPHWPPSTVVAGVPAEIDVAIERAVSPAVERRWRSPGELKLALQAAAARVAASPGGEEPAGVGAVEGGSGLVHLGGLAAGPGETPAPAPAPAAAPAAPTAMPAVVAAPRAGAAPPAGALDETEERWLVQKGNLDFGPFSLVQIRAQIERGEILADHTMLDNESGERCLVRDFPGLGGLVSHARRRLEHARREHAERHSLSTQKKKSLIMTAIVTLVIGSLVGAVFLYVKSRRDTSGGQLASRQEEAEVESFLKGVKIGGLKATVVRRSGTHHASAGGPVAGPNDEFSNDARFGDASRGLAQGDQTLDDDQIQGTMMANYRKLIPCIAHAPGVSEIALDFVVRGTGKVSAVRVNGQKSGALPSCMLGRMQSFNFPKFDGTKTIASWSMSLGR